VAADFISRRALAPVFGGNQKSAARHKQTQLPPESAISKSRTSFVDEPCFRTGVMETELLRVRWNRN